MGKTKSSLNMQNLISLKEELVEDAERIGQYYIVNSLNEDYTACPGCGESVQLNCGTYFFITGRLRTRRAVLPHQSIIYPREAHAMHTECLTSLDLILGNEPDKLGYAQFVAIARNKDYLLMRCELVDALVKRFMAENKLDMDDIINIEEYEDEVEKVPVGNTIPLFPEPKDDIDTEFSDVYGGYFNYTRYKAEPVVVIPKKIKIYPELKIR
jgi:hypothetical protein